MHTLATVCDPKAQALAASAVCFCLPTETLYLSWQQW